ncbi:hypothetical protein E2C01_049754 [Portunus trituberculatus]|uniref:Uncharacterized protein n=1 Tax=Portunus trituberculatus TaxID=210409 RepID=A0A5B7GDZ0_PORTR|nr:hypothetical protein [Portunus trituberculatus]
MTDVYSMLATWSLRKWKCNDESSVLRRDHADHLAASHSHTACHTASLHAPTRPASPMRPCSVVIASNLMQ